MPVAPSLPGLRPQIPPEPKGRLSVPSSRAARNAPRCHPPGSCARLQACRAWPGDAQSGLFTWSRQRRPHFPAPWDRWRASWVEPRRTTPLCGQAQGVPGAGKMLASGRQTLRRRGLPSWPCPWGAGSGVRLNQRPAWVPGNVGRSAAAAHAPPRQRQRPELLTPDGAPPSWCGEPTRL